MTIRCAAALGFQKGTEGGYRGRDGQAIGLGDAQLARAPLQQELSDVAWPPQAEVAVAVTPLPVQGKTCVAGHLRGALGGNKFTVGQPPFESPGE